MSNISLFIVEYYTPGKTEKGTASIRRCSYAETPQVGEVCDFDVRLWGECSPDKFFNYHRNAPCIFLKLNRIYGWIPEYYNDTSNLPDAMPVSLKDHIRSRDPHEVSFNKITIIIITQPVPLLPLLLTMYVFNMRKVF